MSRGTKGQTRWAVLRPRWTGCRCDGGAVLLEYVVLSMTLLLALVGVNWVAAALEMEPLFDPGGAVTGNFGLVGNTLMDWYHRVVDVVALPVP